MSTPTGTPASSSATANGAGQKATKVQQVADILTAASEAFSRLSTLIMDLQPEESLRSSHSSGTRWTDVEVKRLHDAMAAYNTDLQKISEAVKTRTVAQVRAKLKKDGIPHHLLKTSSPSPSPSLSAPSSSGTTPATGVARSTTPTSAPTRISLTGIVSSAASTSSTITLSSASQAIGSGMIPLVDLAGVGQPSSSSITSSSVTALKRPAQDSEIATANSSVLSADSSSEPAAKRVCPDRSADHGAIDAQGVTSSEAISGTSVISNTSLAMASEVAAVSSSAESATNSSNVTSSLSDQKAESREAVSSASQESRSIDILL